MTSTLIRGRYVIADAQSPAIQDGAVLIEGAKVTAVGRYDALAARTPNARLMGSPQHMVIPGLINSHSHGKGLSSFQMGSLDDQLELWLLPRKAQRSVDAYKDTLLAAANLIKSGVTTVLHNSSLIEGAFTYEEQMDRTLSAYKDAGMRVAFASGVRSQNSFVYESDEAFARLLPQPLRGAFERYQGARPPIEPNRYFAAFDDLVKRIGWQGPRHRLLYGPLALQWTGDEQMRAIARKAAQADTGLHIHVQESPYQKELGPRIYGKSIVQQLYELDALGPRTTLAHAVWLSDADIDLMAKTGATYVHNLSSNLRLKSGISPVIRALDRGVNVALGTDSMTINDDDDFIQEMRLVAKIHRLPGLHERDLASHDVFRMATMNGRQVVLFDDVGVVHPGGPADIVVMRLDGMLDEVIHEPGFDPIDLLLYRGKREHVDTVMVAGELLLQDGRLTKVDSDKILDELRIEAVRGVDRPSQEAQRLMKELLPYVRAYYDAWFRECGESHYHYNSRT